MTFNVRHLLVLSFSHLKKVHLPTREKSSNVLFALFEQSRGFHQKIIPFHYKNCELPSLPEVPA